MKDILDKTETEKFLKSVISDKNIELEYVYGNKEYEFKLKNMNDKEVYKYENHNIVILNKHIFNKCLDYCKTNLEYVDNVTDLDIKENMIGFAPDSWNFLSSFVKNKIEKLNVLEDLGLAKKKEGSNNFFDFIINRISIYFFSI